MRCSVCWCTRMSVRSVVLDFQSLLLLIRDTDQLTSMASTVGMKPDDIQKITSMIKTAQGWCIAHCAWLPTTHSVTGLGSNQYTACAIGEMNVLGYPSSTTLTDTLGRLMSLFGMKPVFRCSDRLRNCPQRMTGITTIMVRRLLALIGTRVSSIVVAGGSGRRLLLCCPPSSSTRLRST